MSKSSPIPTFTERLLAWYRTHGRKDLPWQQHPTPYRVWVSEIMLQQTQVATVIPYYQRFIQRFPSVETLASASQDEVLHYWSGLGYYSRGRNLYAAARKIVDNHAGQLPQTLEGLKALPGIGRSTAAAILSLAYGRSHAILDGNVKRVLARYHAIEGWPAQAKVERQLWSLAEQYTPQQQIAAYTQGIMDLGATVCTRAAPQCSDCPVTDGCKARQRGMQGDYPSPRPRKTLPVRATQFVMMQNPLKELLLKQRPPTGLWGGLWGFPECPTDLDIVDWCREQWDFDADPPLAWPVVRHSFSHFQLDITPVFVPVREPVNRIMDSAHGLWYNPNNALSLGLAAPVSKLLLQIQKDHTL